MNKVFYSKKYNKIYYQKNREREMERSRKWRFENPEKVKEMRLVWYREKGKEYRRKNIDKIRASARKYAKKHLQKRNPEKDRIIQARYRLKHKSEITKRNVSYAKKRRETDINYRLMWLLRSRIIIAIKKQLGSKAYKTIELLGCSIQTAREYIEKQFKDGMTWENHGEWEIDHKIPLSSFDLTKSEEQKKAFHYTNLQPLSWKENRIKSNRIII